MSAYEKNRKSDLENSLVGKTVIGLDISTGRKVNWDDDLVDGEGALRFRCNDGSSVVWRTEGDCCSESWWADILELNSLRNHTVAEVLELPLPEPHDDRSRQESDSAYGYAIRTERGVTTAIFRNSSNGYYGGEAFVGEDSDQYDWREITDQWEWSA